MFSSISRSARPAARVAPSSSAPAPRAIGAARRSFASRATPPPQAPESAADVFRTVPRSVKLIAAGGISLAFSFGMFIGRGAAAEDRRAAGAGGASKSPYALRLAGEPAYPPAFGSTDDFLKGIDELRGLFGGLGREDDVSTDDADLESHGISPWSYHPEQKPTVVVWALSTGDVQKVVQIANRYRMPITPFSGGTSLEGHFSSPHGGISLDMSRMDKIVALHEADGDVVVQPGLTYIDLNKELEKHKLFFPLDPGPGATIGGMAATGCSGTNAVRYGTARAEWFLNLTVVLPSGEVIKTRQRARKSAAGWDTTKMFIGAEGTLGIVTEATLRLTPLLPTRCAVVNFPSVSAAVAAATEVVHEGYPVQCVEFLDSLMMEAVNKAGNAGMTYPERDSLFFKFQGSPEQMQEVSKKVATLVKKHGGKDWSFAKNDADAAQLWEGRKVALWSAMALKPDHKCWTTDVCVPISALPTLVESTKKDLAERGLVACHVGHVGDGNFHSLILFKGDEELEKAKEAVHQMVYTAQALDGTATGEHGVGLGKIEYLEAELGKGTIALMESVKKTVDPKGIMNPGKIYPNFSPGGHR